MRKKPTNVYTVVNGIQPLPLSIKNTLSNTHNNPRPQVDCFATNLSTSSRADQYLVSDGIGYSYDRTLSHPTDSVAFQGSKLLIGINISADYLEPPSTPLNGSSSSVIIRITTPFYLRDISPLHFYYIIFTKRILHQNISLITVLFLIVQN